MLIHSDPNNMNSIVYHLIIERYLMQTLHWYFPWATPLHLYNMTGRGEKLQQLHCYHPFSDSLDIYLTKNHYENYSPKMVPITKIWGSGSKCQNESVPRDLLHAIPMLSSFIYQNCLLRVIAVGQSDSPESSHLPAVRKLSTPSDAHAPVGNVDSHLRWKVFLLCLIFEVNHFIRQKQAFNLTRKFIGGMLPRHESEKIPK